MTLIYLMKSELGPNNYLFIEREMHELKEGAIDEMVAHIAKYIGVKEKEDIEYIKCLVCRPIGNGEHYYRLSVLNIPFEVRIQIVERNKCKKTPVMFIPLQKRNWNIKCSFIDSNEDIKEMWLRRKELEFCGLEHHLQEFYNSLSFTKVTHLHEGVSRVSYEKIMKQEIVVD